MLARVSLIAVAVLGLAFTAPAAAVTLTGRSTLPAADSEIEPYSRAPSETRPYALCPPPTKRRASCMAAVVPSEDGEPVVGPGLEGSGVDGGFSPADLRSAYDLPGLGGSGLTVAVTIAYDDPNAEADLAVYRNHYGLPPCTTANGCFEKVNQRGEAKNYPPSNSEWALETSLDLDMVSATCPQCDILLVEADSEFLEDLGPAVEKAAELNATIISGSWATEEFEGETGANPYFHHPGLPSLFATGDWGYGTYYPAASPDAIAVGGTDLRRSGNARGWTEAAWSGAGSGCSPYQEKPGWQRDPGCAGRTVADVSAVADPATPVSVYDTYQQSGWTLLGGTSVATPLVAGIEALSSGAFRAAGPSAFTRTGSGGGLFDVTDGENGPCATVDDGGGFSATYLCQADVGFDGPTGWGTPDGPLSLPVAITEPATVTANDAVTLHGMVDPGGLATAYRFEYGETASYGSSVPIPDASAGSGSGYVDVSHAIGGLQGGTLYHYRVVAANAAGTFPGVDRTFGTTAPIATTGAATEIRSFGATLHATVDPQGLSTRYYFEYGPDSSYGSKRPVRAAALGEGTAVEMALGGLAGSRLYHYRVVARNVAGVAYGEDRVLTTKPADWTAAYLPHPPGAGSGYHAYGVSCLRSDDCIAVGEQFDLGLPADATLAERWDGESWDAMETPNPPGLAEGWKFERYATLRGVSCASAGDCVAVGRYKGSDDVTKPLVETWDGAQWSLLLPSPDGAVAAALQAVSCSGPEKCTAVGYLRDSGGTIETLALRRDGGAWAVQPTPSPPSASLSWLSGVSCPSASSCVAVGTYETAGGAEMTLAEHWDGGNWTIEPMPADPGGRSIARMEAISCNSAAACMAVGYFLGTPSVEGLAEQWDGKGWALRPNPTPDEEGTLYGVSCAAPDRCTAVGTYYSSASFDEGWRSLVERWGGSAWSVLEIEPLSAPAGWWHESWLNSVSCPAATGCLAAGDGLAAPSGSLAEQQAFAEREKASVPPSASFSISPPSPLVGEPVEFDASSSQDPDGAVESYAWDFGDGGHGSGAKATHAYANPGDYLVTLTATDDEGMTGEASHLLHVADPAVAGTSEPDRAASGNGSPEAPPRPANRFVIEKATIRCDGRIVLLLKAPGPGAFAATATATAVGLKPPRRNGAKRPAGSCAPGSHSPPRPGSSRLDREKGNRRFAYGRGAATASAGGLIRLTIAPPKHGLATTLSEIRIAITLTFTPGGGAPSTQSLVVHGR
jgi:hypothetical protein